MATAVAGAATAAAAAVVPEVYVRDAMIAWFRGEFAAANAIIDALCSHLAQIGGAAEYEAVFAAVHRRRLNWIPVLHMQKYYSIADVAAELRVVAANREAVSFASAAEDPTEAKQLVTTPEEDKPVESGGAQAEEEHAASEESVVDGVGIAVEEEAAAEEEPAAAEAVADDGVQVAVVEEAAADEVSSGDSSDHKGPEGGDAKGVSRPHRSQTPVTDCSILLSSSGYIGVFEVDRTALTDHSSPSHSSGVRPAAGNRVSGSLQRGHVLLGMGSTLTRKPWRSLGLEPQNLVGALSERLLGATWQGFFGRYSYQCSVMPSDHNQTGCLGCLPICTGERGRSAASVGSFGGQPTQIGWFGDAPGRSPCQSAVLFGAAADHVTENAYVGPDHRKRVWPVLLEFQRVEHWSRDLLEEYSKLRNILSSMMFDGRSVVARKQQARCNCLRSQEGHQKGQISFNEVNICVGHEDCLARPERIKILKGFVAKESVKGHMASSILPSLGTLSVNVVKGLKLYEDIFTNSELLTLADYINELRLAGRRGQLSGNIELIPTALQTVIDHLVQWRLIPESRKPNSCIINFFDEDEHSQPYFKPPHLDNPISTLLLSDTTMAFGRSLVSDHEGNYKGPLTLSINEGSLLVMRGNSADMARHVVCASPNRRIIITFVKVRAASHPTDSPTALQRPTKTMALWQPAKKAATAGVIACGPHAMIPAAWGLALRSPIVMLPPPRAMVMSPNKKAPRGGTGVFLPWTVGPKKYTRHLPPRIQKRRLPSLPAPLEVRA
ncbi:hypothetical protein MUK42_17631 [Musa troglodytarum]|uniref:Fe2OG dioxygenase domain-containing protein n=1 Tax=Musa troglodytarum TaxID=320322 RepID=A0A9E7KRC8_9LILI|nr:hypothetical protein MUK42_17631 [Musa troglodytarum]